MTEYPKSAEDVKRELEDYRTSLKNFDTLQFINFSGSSEQKARAFDELVRMQSDAKAEANAKAEAETKKTETKKTVRPSESGIRVPFPNRLINKG